MTEEIAETKKKKLKIGFFNHKGGVSKTTTAFHLGWMIAQKGHRVILVDADPQCNLSGLVLGYKGATDFETFYKTEPQRNIKNALIPAFESQPKLIEPVNCVQVPGNENLFLLPGHIGLSEYEVTLGISQELSGSIQTLKNLPGSINYLLEQTAEHHNADFIIIDMNPSLSSINQNLLMISDFFLVPSSPDYFSVMAIDSLSTVIPRWRKWAKQAASLDTLKEATYPFPNVTPKFLGTIIQKYRVRTRNTTIESDQNLTLSTGNAASGFQHWIDEVNNVVLQKFVPMLRSQDMLIDETKYDEVQTTSNYCLAEISDFNSLIAKSQNNQTPVFSLTNQQIGLTGTALEITNDSKQVFFDVFNKLADRVVKLTDI